MRDGSSRCAVAGTQTAATPSGKKFATCGEVCANCDKLQASFVTKMHKCSGVGSVRSTQRHDALGHDAS